MRTKPHDDALFLTEVAATLSDWPARNQVVRRALDHACDELLRLALGARTEAQ
ncbi:MAG: hypothetical protein ABIT10_09275 [Alteraurantiacibacter sp.]